MEENKTKPPRPLKKPGSRGLTDSRSMPAFKTRYIPGLPPSNILNTQKIIQKLPNKKKDMIKLQPELKEIQNKLSNPNYYVESINNIFNTAVPEPKVKPVSRENEGKRLRAEMIRIQKLSKLKNFGSNKLQDIQNKKGGTFLTSCTGYEEKELEKEYPAPVDPNTIRTESECLYDCLNELTEMQCSMTQQFDTLKELRKRVAMTTENVDSHINTVSNLKSILTNMNDEHKYGLERTPKKPPQPVKISRELVAASTALVPKNNIKSKGMNRSKTQNNFILPKVDSLRANIKGKAIRGKSRGNGSFDLGIVRTEGSKVDIKMGEMNMLNNKGYNRPKRVKDNDNTSGKIMNTLISIHGRMNEFSSGLSTQVSAMMDNMENKKGLKSYKVIKRNPAIAYAPYNNNKFSKL